MANSPKQNIIKQLDSMWSHIIREVYDGKCALCGKPGQASHHFFGKGAHSAVRWDLHNGVYCCFGCHIGKIHRQGDTEPARDALIQRIGVAKFQVLKEKAHTVCKMRKYDYLAVREYLKAMSDPEMIEALRHEGE